MIAQLLSETPLWMLLVAQSTGSIAAGLAASYALKRHPARAHQMLLIALATSVFMPTAYLLVRHFELGMLPAEVSMAPSSDTSPAALAETPPIESPLAFTDVDLAVTEAIPEEPLPVAPAGPARTALPWSFILATGWAAVSTALLGRILLQFALGLRLLRASAPLETPSVLGALQTAKARLRIRRPVLIACHSTVRSPVIWCWSRTPVLLVQRLDEDTPAGDWVGVFCHELAHLKRGDHLSGVFAEILAAAIPWHPLSWWARGRLARLSEEACDDWVLLGGQTPLDYAETLLHLSPQRRTTFLPTVVGKETTMKARIYRIVKDQCNDPRIGRRWALALCLLVTFTTTTVALAQRQRMPRQSPERPLAAEADQRGEPPQTPALAGRRNVLERMLDQLVAQAEETEARLKERGERSDEETVMLHSELRTLREQIGMIERQLQALNRPGPRVAVPRRPSLDRSRPRGEAERLENLRARQNEIRARLDEIGDPDNPEARELREQLARLDVETRQAEARERARQAATSRASRAGTNKEGVIDDLRKHQDDIRARLNEIDDPDNAEARELRKQLEATRRQIDLMENAPAARRDQEAAGHVRALHSRLRELQTQVKENERQLERLDDPDSERGLDLRHALENLRREMATLEEEVQHEENAAAMRRTTVRLIKEGRRDQLRQRIAETERALKEREERGLGDSDEAKELREVLGRLHEDVQAMEETETQFREQQATRNRGARPRQEVAPMGPYGQGRYESSVTQRRGASVQSGPRGSRATSRDAVQQQQPGRPDVQRQVEELRGQVDGLNAQMEEMRQMIRQLLERREERQTEVQETAPY